MERDGPINRALAEGHHRLTDIGELTSGARRAIQEAFLQELGARRGRAAWVTLEARAAQHVRPLWVAAFAPDDEPYSVLQDALASLDAVQPSPTLANRVDTVYANVVDRHYEATDFRPTYAGFAAWAAARTALDRSGSHPVRNVGELEIPTQEWDASFYASLAASGGAVWENLPRDSAKERLHYWEWYLDEAARVVDGSGG